jgi:CTP:molybdopterin cytidylyltransferase MocA
VRRPADRRRRFDDHDHVDDVDVLVLCPVDAPFGTPAIVAALIASVVAGAAAAVVTVDGIRGHPVAFGRGAFGALRLAGSRGGPRQVLDELDEVVAVPSSDRRLCLDVNTVADLARARQLSG